MNPQEHVESMVDMCASLFEVMKDQKKYIDDCWKRLYKGAQKLESLDRLVIKASRKTLEIKERVERVESISADSDDDYQSASTAMAGEIRQAGSSRPRRTGKRTLM